VSSSIVVVLRGIQISGKLSSDEEEIFGIIRRLQAVGVKIPFTTVSNEIINQVNVFKF
jgi:hypothetical protein